MQSPLRVQARVPLRDRKHRWSTARWAPPPNTYPPLGWTAPTDLKAPYGWVPPWELKEVVDAEDALAVRNVPFVDCSVLGESEERDRCEENSEVWITGYLWLTSALVSLDLVLTSPLLDLESHIHTLLLHSTKHRGLFPGSTRPRRTPTKCSLVRMLPVHLGVWWIHQHGEEAMARKWGEGQPSLRGTSGIRGVVVLLRCNAGHMPGSPPL